MNSFYSIIYNKFAELQISESDSARFAYPVNDLLPFLSTGKRISDCVVGVPPIRLAQNAISYGPFVFDDGEFGQIASVKLIVASISLLSAKSIFRWIYRDPIKEWYGKKPDGLRARYVINCLLDTLARKRIRKIQGDAFHDDAIRSADALSILLLSRASNQYPIMAQAGLAASVLDAPVYLPAPIMKMVQGFMSEFANFSSTAAKIIAAVEDKIPRAIETGEITIKQSGWEELSPVADSLYQSVEEFPGKWHNMYLPYSQPLSKVDSSGVSIFQSGMISAEDFGKIKPTFKDLRIHDDTLWQETFFELVRENKFREKIMQKLVNATKNLNISEVMFPVCDYVSFSRMQVELSADIRKISDRVRLVKNAFDESTFQEMGNIDLNVAIQAIASESRRNDIFTRDEELLKDESWTIVIDASKSLSGSTDDLRAVSVCLAETAHLILGANPWGMFAFSDELFCIKDFAERYDNQIKARIGGLKLGGLSHIPDAIRACSNLVKGHSKERNFMILVTDGVPSGYSNIEEEFGISVKELRSQGISLIAIGLGSTSIRKTVRDARLIGKASDIAKEFMQVYMNLSS